MKNNKNSDIDRYMEEISNEILENIQNGGDGEGKRITNHGEFREGKIKIKESDLDKLEEVLLQLKV